MPAGVTSPHAASDGSSSGRSATFSFLASVGRPSWATTPAEPWRSGLASCLRARFDRALNQRGERRDAWIGSMLPTDLERGPPEPARVGGWPLSPVELHTSRLLLRAFRDDDAQS